MTWTVASPSYRPTELASSSSSRPVTRRAPAPWPFSSISCDLEWLDRMYDAVMVTMGYGRRAQAVRLAGLAALLALHGCSADGGPEEGDDGVDAGQEAAAASDPFWSALSEAAWLEPRMEHTAVWSGTEMIVWGGVGGSIESEPSFGDGGRYDPSTE